MPPTLLVRDFLRSIDLAITQEQQYLSRGSIPSGAWVFEEWDRNEVKEWKQENEENIKGKPHKSLMFAGQGGGVHFEPMSMNFKELEFTERMRWYARVVASVFQVPTAVVGIEPEKINYHTFQGERENFEANTLGPYLQKIERVINDQYVRPHWGSGYRFEFKPGMSESTRGMISERVRSEFSAGLTTRNEARRELGRDPVDDPEDGFKDEVYSDPDGGAFGPSDDAGDGGPDTGNPNSTVAASKDADGPLRETDEWYLFDVQPGEVKALHESIADDVSELFEAVLSDAEIRAEIESLAVDDDETEKSLTGLTRKLRELVSSHDVAASIADAIRSHTAEAVEESLQDAMADAEGETDVDTAAIRSRLEARSVEFADAFANRMSEEIRSTVADGWAEGKNSLEIAEEISEQANISEGWTGAERIARQELQIASGQARSAVADQLEKVEVWHTSGDNRVRDAHSEMHGKWKRPGEKWEVDYSARGRGVQKEDVPGDSRPGIGCRCVTLLRDIDEVDDADHAGVAT